MRRQLIFLFIIFVFSISLYSQDTNNVRIDQLNDTIVFIEGTQLINETDEPNNYGKEKLESFPNNEINGISVSQPGVASINGYMGITENIPISVLGGSPEWNSFIIDGISYRDPFTGKIFGTIPFSAIEIIETHFGAFSVKYGNVLSGLFDIKTRIGKDTFFGGGEAVTSSLTDNYNYNLYNGFLGGPIIPGNTNYHFFAAIENVNVFNDNIRSENLKIPTANIDSETLPHNGGEVFRFIGKLNGKFGDLSTSFNAVGSYRDARDYLHRYSKNNSAHNPRVKDDVLVASLNIHHDLNQTANWGMNFRYQSINHQKGDGIWFDDLFAYGDSIKNAQIGVILPQGDGSFIRTDTNGVFWDNGHVYNFYEKYKINTISGSVYFSKQFDKLNLNFGGSFEQNTVRYYGIYPVYLAYDQYNDSNEDKYYRSVWRFYGYDITGKKEINTTITREISGDKMEEAGAKKPITSSIYLDGYYNYENFYLNAGLRYTNFNPNFNRINDLNKVLGDDGVLTKDDYEKAPSENMISPRIGLVFELLVTSYIYTNYGIYWQRPDYISLYDSWNNIDNLESRDGAGQNLGHLGHEKMTKFNIGINHYFNESINIELSYFYNVQNYSNVLAYSNFIFGASEKGYITYTNADNGIVYKGPLINFNYVKHGFFNININYAYITKGIDSSTGNNSSFVAAFRSQANQQPILNIPDQNLHMLNMSFNISLENIESSILDNTRLSMISVYLDEYIDLPPSLVGYDRYGNITVYSNPKKDYNYFRVDLKIDRNIRIGKINLTPYIWIQNLFNRANYNRNYSQNFYENTGTYVVGPNDLPTSISPEGYISDYYALQNDPEKYDVPRLIRLGLRIDF